jgi:ParB family chromosome partitioning protein
MVRRTGLGRGLDALIPGGEPSAPSDGITLIPVQSIQPNPRQPRSTFKPEELEDLSNSIREHGILQPLIVSSAPVDGTYILIAGERRLKAAIQAGLETVPAMIRQVSDEQQLELALIENIQRADLNALETAEAYRHLAEDFHLSHEEIAAKVGKNRATVTNTLRLLKLPEAGRKAVLDGSITEGHARAILALSTPQAQLSALQVILKQNLNVRQTELLVQRLNGHRTSAHKKDQPDPEISSIEEKLRSSLGTKVNLHHGKKGGSIVIHYYSDEELGAILDRLTNE